MTIVQQLKAAQALIPSPEFWTRSVMARDAKNVATTPKADDAVRFCLVGAVRRATGEAYSPAEIWLGNFVDGDTDTLTRYNDYSHTRWEDVMVLFDFAILAAKDEERDFRPCGDYSLAA